MKKLIILGISMLIIILVVVALAAAIHSFSRPPTAVSTSSMNLTSTAFADHSPIPSMCTCDGKGISPPLTISGVPALARSLVLFLEDPDAAVGIFDHWVVFDIDPATTEIPEGTEPAGTHGKGSAGNLTYMGPCPPSGMHRYLFTAYALDTKLGLAEGASKLDVVNAMNGHVLEHTQLVGTYSRSKI